MEVDQELIKMAEDLSSKRDNKNNSHFSISKFFKFFLKLFSFESSKEKKLSKKDKLKKTLTGALSALVIVLVVAGFFILGYFTFIKGGRPSAKLVPSDVFMYATLNTDKSDEQGKAVRELLFPEDDSRSNVIKGLMLNLMGFYATDIDLSLKYDIEPWIGKEIAIFQKTPSQDSSPVFMVDVGSITKFLKVFSRLKQQTADSMGQLEEIKYKRVNIITISDIRNASFSYFKGFLLASQAFDSLKYSVDSARSSVSSLAKDEQFRLALTKIDQDSMFYGIMDIRSFVDRAISTGLIKSSRLEQLVSKIKREIMAFSIKNYTDGAFAKLFVGSEFIDTDLYHPELINFIHKDVSGFIGGKDIEKTIQGVLETETETGIAKEVLSNYFKIDNIATLKGFNEEFVLGFDKENGKSDIVFVTKNNSEISKEDLEKDLNNLSKVLWGNPLSDKFVASGNIEGNDVGCLKYRASEVCYLRTNDVLIFASSRHVIEKSYEANKNHLSAITSSEDYIKIFQKLNMESVHFVFYFSKQAIGAEVNGAMKNLSDAFIAFINNYTKALGGVVTEDYGTLFDIFILKK